MLHEGGQAGDYQVLELIGEGGMGRVFRARHLRTGHEAALKVRVGGGDRDADEARRFQREASYMAQLNHPNLVKIFDVGETRGQLWLAMERLDGDTLSHHLETKGRIQPELAARWIADAARGLSVLHEASIAHRDIKPDNIMITTQGVVKVMDFGLAREATATVLTRTGEMVGTPAYLAPETLTGEGDHRVDLWQLGVVLYLMITSELPFQADSMSGYLEQVAKAPITPVRQHAAGCPDVLVAIVEHMLRKDPRERPASMHLVAEALAAVVELIETGASAARRRAAIPRQRVSRELLDAAPREPGMAPLLIGAALAGIGLALGAVALWRGGRVEPVSALASVAAPPRAGVEGNEDALQAGTRALADQAAAALEQAIVRRETNLASARDTLQALGVRLGELAAQGPRPGDALAAVRAMQRVIAAEDAGAVMTGAGEPQAFAAAGLGEPPAQLMQLFAKVDGPLGYRARILAARLSAESAPARAASLCKNVNASLLALRQASDGGDALAAEGLVDALLATAAIHRLAGEEARARALYREVLRCVPEKPLDVRGPAVRAAAPLAELFMRSYRQDGDRSECDRARALLPKLSPVRAAWEAGFRRREPGMSEYLF